MVVSACSRCCVASLVLTSSVVSRYFFKASTDWQDEAAVFCLVGATFLCGAFVQADARPRRHRGGRRRCCRGASSACGCIAASICSASRSAPSSPGSRGRCSTRPGSTSRRPRRRGRRRSAIPYGLMALGMTLLVAAAAAAGRRGADRARARGGARDESMLALGLLFGGVTLLFMFSGAPIAFALGAVAVALHGVLHAGVVARHRHAERLRGDGEHHAAVDPALHPEGRGDRPLARRPGPLRSRCTPG